MKDFFVSYNSADKTWAEWIAWVLEENGYTVVIQAWDFRPGGNFILDMQRAADESHRTIMVLSEDYLKAKYTQPEWAAAFKQDPTAEERRLIPIRVAKCSPTGLLAPLVYVDLVEKTEADAEHLVLAALKDRAKPAIRPSFPDSASAAERVMDQKIEFPGLAAAPNNLPRSGTNAFVGRETDLANLHTQLHQSDRVAITALRGMGVLAKPSWPCNMRCTNATRAPTPAASAGCKPEIKMLPARLSDLQKPQGCQPPRVNWPTR